MEDGKKRTFFGPTHLSVHVAAVEEHLAPSLAPLSFLQRRLLQRRSLYEVGLSRCYRDTLLVEKGLGEKFLQFADHFL